MNHLLTSFPVEEVTSYTLKNIRREPDEKVEVVETMRKSGRDSQKDYRTKNMDYTVRITDREGVYGIVYQV